MEEMVYFYPKGHEAHYETGHPERPERVEAIKTALIEQGWWEEYPKIDPLEIPDDVITSIHESYYLNNLESICLAGQHYDMDTYTTPASWILALNAAGGAIAVSEYVWSRSSKCGLALTRPPGHHATKNRAMGFCLLNNVALAAEYLIQEKDAQKIAIIDIDLHHGNGTQEIFYNRGDVFYFSTHQYPHYPGTGSLNETGSGQGRGATTNIPLPPMSGDRAINTVTDEIILPLLTRFRPEMILVSYGFDAHWRDPLGYLLFTSQGYYQAVQSITKWANVHCQGRIALFLEGGYDLEAAKICSLAVTAAISGFALPDLNDSSPTTEGRNWEKVVDQTKHLWEL